MLLTVALAAQASTYTDAFALPDTAPFTPRAGYAQGYVADPWRISSGRLGAARDDGGGLWGQSQAIDNWLVRSDRKFRDFTYEVTVQTGDDDGQGVVFRWQDARHFYLAVFASSGGTPPAAGTGGTLTASGAWLYAVENGVARELAWSSRTLGNAAHRVQVRAEGPSIEVLVDGTVALSATDDAMPEGSIGFYCYENGSDAGCWFDDVSVVGTDPTKDADGDGVFEVDDCDDSDSARSTAVRVWPDADRDGFGDGAVASVDVCEPPDGTAANADDCDDTDDAVNPSAVEVCNGVDDDCDGAVDAGATDAIAWYDDRDGDGFGDPEAATVACDEPADAVSGAGGFDCDDDDPDANPAADEIWYDGVDQDCDGSVDWDRDGDGAIGADAGGPDCDDGTAAIGPAGEDIPDDGLDQNCNGADAVTTAGRSCGCATSERAVGGAWSALVLFAAVRGRGRRAR